MIFDLMSIFGLFCLDYRCTVCGAICIIYFFLFFRRPLNYLNDLLKLLQTSNAIYNVFIYSGMNSKFRQKITSLFLCKKYKVFTTILSGRSNRSNNTVLVRNEVVGIPLVKKNNRKRDMAV